MTAEVDPVKLMKQEVGKLPQSVYNPVHSGLGTGQRRRIQFSFGRSPKRRD